MVTLGFSLLSPLLVPPLNEKENNFFYYAIVLNCFRNYIFIIIKIAYFCIKLQISLFRYIWMLGKVTLAAWNWTKLESKVKIQSCIQI